MAARNPVNWKHDEHKSLRMVQSVIEGMKKKTGRSMEEWLKLVNQRCPGWRRTRRMAEERTWRGHKLCRVDCGLFLDRKAKSAARRNTCSMPRTMSRKCLPGRSSTCGVFTTKF